MLTHRRRPALFSGYWARYTRSSTIGSPRVVVPRLVVVGRLITISEVQELLRPSSPDGHLSRRRADQITRKVGFPEPAQKTPAGRFWDEDDVRTWIAANRSSDDTDLDNG
ncbi:hypothetical protein Ga0074812_10540 [Parafrankia irregularis]|uniref:Transcriptional regulator, AlpA family n=1 Tax=Parafrankia irregularis TaxID=795642 RepID=A0A0S4QJW0_9ACTN|nr:hypothetical protein [Parafrankia sp. CH37]CUU55391.1 hypothetical protein Ga0074812_10540 [Parafrankia irregularis]